MPLAELAQCRFTNVAGKVFLLLPTSLSLALFLALLLREGQGLERCPYRVPYSEP